MAESKGGKKKPAAKKKATPKRRAKAKAVVIRCRGADVCELDKLCDFQGGLKDLSQSSAMRLRAEILNMGFSAPFHVWIDPDGGTQILDGHQRRKMLISLRNDGYEIPPLPVDFIDADSWKEAKVKLLGLTSMYGHFTEEGMEAYLKEAGIDLSTVETRFDLGEDFIAAMRKRANEALDPNKAPWNWKLNPPAEKPLSDEEMAVPFAKWLKGFKRVYVLFSGGKDSMAMVGWFLDHKFKKEKLHLIHCRTAIDHENTEELAVQFMEENGFTYDVIGKEYTDEEFVEMFERIGFPTRHLPWCTTVWKIAHFRRYIREHELADRDDVCLAIGWRREEAPRREKALERCIGSYRVRMARPIMDMKEDEVYESVAAHGWALHPCYVRAGPQGYCDRLGCYGCFASRRADWLLMREKNPAEWIKTVLLLALGAASPNISHQTLADQLRMVCGMSTVNAAREKMKLPIKVGRARNWQEPAFDPYKDPELMEGMTAENFAEAKALQTSETD